MQTILSKKSEGFLACHFKKIETKQINLREIFLEELGYKTNRIKDHWVQIDEKMAKEIHQYILSVNMAYDTEIETKPFANDVIDFFFRQFSLNVSYYTNGNFEKTKGLYRIRGWRPITDYIFDTGVLAVDKEKIAILWAADND